MDATMCSLSSSVLYFKFKSNFVSSKITAASTPREGTGPRPHLRWKKTHDPPSESRTVPDQPHSSGDWLPHPVSHSMFKPLMNQPYHQWVTRLRKVVRASIDRAGLQCGWSANILLKESFSINHESLHESQSRHNKAFLADYHVSGHLKISEVVCMLHGYYPLDISEGCWYCKQCHQALLNYTLYNIQWLRDLTLEADVTICKA